MEITFNDSKNKLALTKFHHSGNELISSMDILLERNYRTPLIASKLISWHIGEVLYHWFCKDGGKILDPFAGGSVRGIVANYLGYKYTGIDIRPEQVASNKEQGVKILGDRTPTWLCGDSNIVLDTITDTFDFLFSCPPYADLEVYSEIPGDISNMPYHLFKEAYYSIIKKASKKLKPGGYACFVVGEVRDKRGNYFGFVPDTIQAFRNCGLGFYNDAVLLNSIGTAPIRASNSMKNDKLVKVHQNILVFKKF